MPYCYAGFDKFKDGAKRTTSADDDLLLIALETASEEVAGMIRPFHTLVQTRYPGHVDRLYPTRLWLDADLVSVTTLKVDDDGDGTYELTLVADTDYRLWPYTVEPNTPYRAVEIIPTGTQLSAWPTIAHRVQLAGVWGYSAETESAGTTAEALDASETEITMTSGHTVQRGDTLIIGTEYLYVPSLSANTLTVTRGANGSTAAAHDSGATVYRRRYPRKVELATQIRAQMLMLDMRTGGSGAALGGPDVGYDPLSANDYRTYRSLLRDLMPPVLF